MGRFHDFLEWVVPSEAFAASPSKDRDLAAARALHVIFYVAVFGFVIYTIVMLMLIGRIEVMRSYIKLEVVEAPSVAVCPFNRNTSIIKQGVPWIEAELVLQDGRVKMNSTPYDCINLKALDRGCVCLDLGKYNLHDHSIVDVSASKHGFLHHMEMLYRERVELSMLLADPSGEDTLEIGLYSSSDKLPDWFFIGQGSNTVGNIELATWTATDISMSGLDKTLAGDATAMAKYRYMYTFNGFQVGKRGMGRAWNQTKLSYEMKNFFVDETVSSQRAYSLYGLGVLCFIFIMKTAIHRLFVNATIPEIDPNKGKIVQRELSPASEWFAYLCCCCYPGPPALEGETSKAEVTEKTRLVQ